MTPRQRVSAALCVLNAEIGTIDDARARLVEASRQLQSMLDQVGALVPTPPIPDGMETFTCVDCGGVYPDPPHQGGCPRLRCPACVKRQHAAKNRARYYRVRGLSVGEEGEE